MGYFKNAMIKKTAQKKKKTAWKTAYKRRVPRALSEVSNSSNVIRIVNENSEAAPLISGGLFIYNDSILLQSFIIYFKLEDMINYLKWTEIYDQFRINRVTVKFTPIQTEIVNRPYTGNSAGTYPSTNTPMFYTVIDDDGTASNTALTSIDQAKGYNTCIETKATKPIKRTFVPKVLNPLYKFTGALTTAYQKLARQPWIDCQNGADVPHFSMPIIMGPAAPSGCYGYKVSVLYDVSFKGRRK